MGYEVLDEHGAVTAAPVGAARAVGRVVDLTEPGPGPPPGPTAPALRSTSTRVGLLVLAVVVGALVGSLLTQRQQRLADLTAREAAFTVAAQATAVAPFTLPIGVGAQLQVVVTNLGPLPVEVLASDRLRSDTDQGTRRAVVTVLGAGTDVAPGTSVQVEMRVPVDCRPGRSITTRLPLRTVDGTRHDVAVSLPDDGRPPAGLCPTAAGATGLRAELAGTVSLPVLQLTNLGDRPLQVELPAQGLTPETAGSVVQVITRPRLPTTVRPHDVLSVRLRFVAHRCVGELQDLRRLDIVNLAVRPTALTTDGPRAGDPVPVDVSAVVAAAMVRVCG